MSLPQKLRNIPTMIVGIDVVNMGRNCIVGLAATYNQYLHQHFSAIHKQTLSKGEKMTKEEQEQIDCENRQKIISEFMKAAFNKFVNSNNGRRPEQILIYRDGVGGPTYQRKVLLLEGPNGALQQAIRGFD